MITSAEARAAAAGEIAAMSERSGIECVLLDAFTMTEPYGWVFFYDSRRHQETDDIDDAIAGNCPLLVLAGTGEIRSLGTAHEIAYYLAPYRSAHAAGSPVEEVRTPR